MPTDRHLPSRLAIWSEILCHSSVVFALVCSHVGGARLKLASVLGILHPAWLERQKGDLGGIRRAVLWAKSVSRLSCSTERDWWEVEKVPAISWHTTVSLVPPRDHALCRVLDESTFDFKTDRNFSAEDGACKEISNAGWWISIKVIQLYNEDSERWPPDEHARLCLRFNKSNTDFNI